MKTLLVSNYLKSESLPGVGSLRWEEKHPSPADFQCVILDMKLDTNIDSATPTVNYGGYPFYSLFDDVIRLLQAGGILLCLNYYTFINQASLFVDAKVHKAIREKKLTTFCYEHKWLGQEETSYDWLDQGFLYCTKLDQMNVMPGSQFRVIAAVDPVKNYFSYVTEYHKVILSIHQEGGAQRSQIKWDFRGDPTYSSTIPTKDEVEVLAVTEVTRDPIAVAVKYRGFPGKLVFLPTYDLSKFGDSGREQAARDISWKLHLLGEHYYDLGRKELGVKLETPQWLLQYRAKPAKDADKELENIGKAKTATIAKRDKYDRILALINGYGDALENAVEELFGTEWLRFEVEKTEPGHPVDLFVRHRSTGQTLAVQVTGVVGKFTQRDKHFGALMGYLPEHEEKNAEGRTERIVLVVNTYRDTPLASRTDTDDISLQVRNLAKRNGICLVKSCDLYGLWNRWVEAPEKLSADDIFRQLFECEGIWQQK